MQRHRTSVAALVTACALIALAGCGGGSVGDTAAQPAAPATSGAAAQPSASVDTEASTAPSVEPSKSPQAAETTAAKPKPAEPRSVGALAFSGTTLSGKSYDASKLAGKPVVLWFWAPWCSTCAAEAPDVLSLDKALGDKVGILGVAGLDTAQNMQPFVDRTNTGRFTHLSDPKGEIWRQFKIAQQSTYVLLDKNGQVTYSGVLSGDDLRNRVTALAA